MNTQANQNLIPARTFCSCGCGMVIFERDTQVVANLEENPVFKCGELNYIELFVPGHKGGAVKTVACPGCSGQGVQTDDPQVLRCQGCGGIYTDHRFPIVMEQAIKFVAVHLPMLANAGAAGQFYFDLDITRPSDGGRQRLHGWADRQTKRVVQWG